MMILVKAGSTDVSIDLWVADSSSSTGAGLTGVAYNAAGLSCYYRRGATGTVTALTLATQTVGGAHSDGGFVETSSSNMPGAYRLDLSDAIVAAGVPYVVIMLKGATNMAPTIVLIQLVSFDPGDSTRLGLAALPSAAPAANGGLPTVDASNGVTLRALDSPIIQTGTAQAGALGSITLASAASTTNHLYNGCVIRIVSGAGAGQTRSIVSYAGSTRIATPDHNWVTAPDNTSVYTVAAHRAPLMDEGGQVFAAEVTGDVTGDVLGAIGSLAAQAKADVNAEVDAALNTAIPGSPVADSVNERLKALDDAYTAVRAALLDNLNATVSSRASQSSLDTLDDYVDTEIASILNRLGAFTGSGLNTVLGFFRALFNKGAGLTPSDLISGGLTGDNTTDSLEAVRDNQGSSGATAQQVWAYATRTLTQTAAQIAAIVSGSAITLHRGETLSISLTGIGALTGRAKLWFTAKSGTPDPDSAALIKIEESAGLQIIDGAVAATAANGSITVTDAAAGDLTIVLTPVESAKLPPVTSGVWDIQMRDGSGNITTKVSGTLVVNADVTRET